MKLPRIPSLPLAALAAVAFFPAASARLDAADPESRASSDGRPTVNVVIARRSSESTPLLLPANIQAFQDTPLFARATGYLSQWTVDIGDKVKAGQTLAVIDVPDLDQQLNQAKANLAQAIANQTLAKINAERWKDLGRQNAVAQQDVDQKLADYAVKNANVLAAQAEVDRLTQLKSFELITAPYDGVISARNTQIGALVSAGSGTELFHLSQTHILRVFVNVPQSYVRDIEPNIPVEVVVPEFPGKVFKGKVVRSAGALDASSRTLLTEVQIPNESGELLAGMFGQVRFKLKPAAPSIIIPANAAIIRAEGTLVATVSDTGTIHIQKVHFGRDFGTQIEILEGLKEGARIVANPNDSLAEGMSVDVASPEDKAKQ